MCVETRTGDLSVPSGLWRRGRDGKEVLVYRGTRRCARKGRGSTVGVKQEKEGKVVPGPKWGRGRDEVK